MFVVIMAGGQGTRFWPASREKLPKQFLKIISEKTMLEETLARIEPLVQTEKICVVVNALHEELTKRLLGNKVKILAEPIGRNTAACIGLAVTHLLNHGKNEPIIAVPADHFISDVQTFRNQLLVAAEMAKEGGIVTFGIKPTRPETGYGYIEKGEIVSPDKQIFKVERFVEKPNLEKALEFLSSGKYLWNSGIFVFTAETILSEIETLQPSLHQGLLKIGKAIGSENYMQVLTEVYENLESISLDYAVMEKTQKPVYVIEALFEWSDVGSWQALYELRDGKDDAGNLALADAIFLDSKRNLVYSEANRLVCLLGVEELIIVDTSDALLVANLKNSQEIRKIPEFLRKNKKSKFC
ncbi:MAG: mannose-1-phosphate guanylyltransferase [Pyrinomonadaceae bacterium]|nr:MAG: mannose-1-phosphate guanylyltransferase [Pyrinomonadaceae bacterium]